MISLQLIFTVKVGQFERVKVLARWIMISEILPWDRKSYLTQAILHLYLGRQVTSSYEITSSRIQGLLEA